MSEPDEHSFWRGAPIFHIPIDVPGVLSIVRRPRGGDWLEDDISALRREGVSVLVSLLGRDEEEELNLASEANTCERCGIQFMAVPVQDLAAPSDARAFIESVHRFADLLRNGAHVAVHCRQSVGRSGLLAVSISVACGLTLDEALEVVSAARGIPVPETEAQREWLRQNAVQVAHP